jgi:hypothetical protein
MGHHSFASLPPSGKRAEAIRPYFRRRESAGLSSLNEGAKVSYEVVANRGKESAETSW